MSHLSGTFSHADAGRLLITFSGTFYQGTYRDGGFPSSSGGVGNILVRAFVGLSGSYYYTEPLDRYAPSSVLDVAYPGGSEVWDIGTDEVSHQNPTSGLWSYGIANLRIAVVLRKK